MAADCIDGNYLGEYSRFFAKFVANVNPDDQLPVSVNVYDVTEAEIVGEIIGMTLRYLDQTYCPASLQAHISHLVIQEIKSLCKKHPEECGWRQEKKTYAPLKLMHAVTNKVNEICFCYLDNSRLALLPPPPATPLPLVSANAVRNKRRKMEDRYVVLHDLHTMFSIQDDSVVNYYAVFDGHAGQDAAVYCATHLHQYLAESIHYPTDPERALRDAFITTDARFIEKSELQNLRGGTTAVCALLMGKKLYIAWVGDSIATMIKRGTVEQLVNPHRPNRDDEMHRLTEMGGIVLQRYGVWRVNGALSISRAIGDVRYKPFISGDPDIRCIWLDGTEDFLILACDGFWDFVDGESAAMIVYKQVQLTPHDLSQVHKSLIDWAKYSSSLDNISVIVVFLTPPSEIAARPPDAHPLLLHPAVHGMNTMDPNNPFMSISNGEYDVNAHYVKQQQQQDDGALQQHANGGQMDDGHILFGAPSNGKHENGDPVYDYEDLGPETDVDAVDDVSESCPDIEKLSRDAYPGEKARIDDNESDFRNPADEDLPPSAHRAKPNQNALITDADNVADSEDSEDEWNYYRIDPNKEKDSTTLVNETCETNEVHDASSPDPLQNTDAEKEAFEEGIHIPEADVHSSSIEASQPSEEEKYCLGVDHPYPVEAGTHSLETDTYPLEGETHSLEPETHFLEPETHSLEREAYSLEPEAHSLEPETHSFDPETHPLDSETHPLDSQTHPLDSQTHPLDSEIYPLNSEIYPVDSETHPEDFETYSLDLEAHPLDSETHPLDAETEPLQTETHPLDSETYVLNSETHRLDSETHPLDAETHPLEDVIHPLDSKTHPLGTEEHTLQSAINPFETETFSEDSVTHPLETEIHSLKTEETHSLDAEGYFVNKELIETEEHSTKEKVDSEEDEAEGETNPSLVQLDNTPEIQDKERVSSELIDTNIKAEGESQELEQPTSEDQNHPEEQHRKDNMDFHLNPDAAEFVPVSPAVISSRRNRVADFPISGSPLKQTSTMDDIAIPSEREFEEEISQRPREMEDEERSNGDNSEYFIEKQKPTSCGLDESEISSTKAEFGDESTTSFLTATDFQRTGISMLEDSYADSNKENYDISKDPMAMSLTPADFVAAFKKEVDLNAVHDLSTTDVGGEQNGVCEYEATAKEPESPGRQWSASTKLDFDDPEFVTSPENETWTVSSAAETNESPVINKECHYSADDIPLSPQQSSEFEIGEHADFGYKMDSSTPEIREDKAEAVSTEHESQEEDLQEESRTMEKTTPSTVSPVPDLMEQQIKQDETDLLSGLENAKVSSTTTTSPLEFMSQLRPNAEEFKLGHPISGNDTFEDSAADMQPPEDTIPSTENVLDLEEVSAVQNTESQVEPSLVAETIIEDQPKENLVEFMSIPESCPTNPEKIEFRASSPIFNNEVPVQNVENVIEAETVSKIETQQMEPETSHSLNLSESVQEFTGLEQQLEPVPEISKKEVEVQEVKEDVVVEKEPVKEDIVEVEVAEKEIVPEVSKEPEIIEKPTEPEKSVETKDEKETVSEATAVAAAVATAVAATTVFAAASKTKAKATATKSTKPSMITKTSTTKSTPTSPSKSVSAAAKTNSTTAAKKPITSSAAARPKQLESTMKSTVTSTVSKTALTKSSTATKATTTTRPTSRVSITSTAPPKPKLATTTTKSAITATDKKLTTNGEVKATKTTVAAKTSKSTAQGSTTNKSTLVKSSNMSRTSTTTTMAKSRPQSAVTAASKPTSKPASTTTSTTGTFSTSRPRTAPTSVTNSTPKSRVSTGKSPMIDKQIKETANKQISLARSTGSTTNKTSRPSTTTTSSTVKRTITGKTTTPATASSPTKKVSVTTKLTSKSAAKSSASTTITTTTTKSKVVQNGISGSVTNTIVTNKIEEDVPKKDLSPVIAPTDNQLIVSAD